jgi:hypothetical protein
LLKGLGAEPASLNVQVVSSTPHPDGKNDPENRVVSIRVSPWCVYVGTIIGGLPIDQLP